VEKLRQELYPRLLPIAREWQARLDRDAEWPDTLDEWLDICHHVGQLRPTSILLRYREGTVPIVTNPTTATAEKDLYKQIDCGGVSAYFWSDW
jgi:hypothetical protein